MAKEQLLSVIKAAVEQSYFFDEDVVIIPAWISKIKQRECLLIKFNGHSFFFFAYKTH